MLGTCMSHRQDQRLDSLKFVFSLKCSSLILSTLSYPVAATAVCSLALALALAYPRKPRVVLDTCTPVVFRVFLGGCWVRTGVGRSTNIGRPPVQVESIMFERSPEEFASSRFTLRPPPFSLWLCISYADPICSFGPPSVRCIITHNLMGLRDVVFCFCCACGAAAAGQS